MSKENYVVLITSLRLDVKKKERITRSGQQEKEVEVRVMFYVPEIAEKIEDKWIRAKAGLGKPEMYYVTGWQDIIVISEIKENFSLSKYISDCLFKLSRDQSDNGRGIKIEILDSITNIGIRIPEPKLRELKYLDEVYVVLGDHNLLCVGKMTPREKDIVKNIIEDLKKVLKREGDKIGINLCSLTSHKLIEVKDKDSEKEEGCTLSLFKKILDEEEMINEKSSRTIDDLKKDIVNEIIKTIKMFVELNSRLCEEITKKSKEKKRNEDEKKTNRKMKLIESLERDKVLWYLLPNISWIPLCKIYEKFYTLLSKKKEEFVELVNNQKLLKLDIQGRPLLLTSFLRHREDIYKLCTKKLEEDKEKKRKNENQGEKHVFGPVRQIFFVSIWPLSPLCELLGEVKKLYKEKCENKGFSEEIMIRAFVSLRKHIKENNVVLIDDLVEKFKRNGFDEVNKILGKEDISVYFKARSTKELVEKVYNFYEVLKNYEDEILAVSWKVEPIEEKKEYISEK